MEFTSYRYLVDQRWLKQWKIYSGFDSWNQENAGKEAVNPGPVDNSNLLKSMYNKFPFVYTVKPAILVKYGATVTVWCH